MIAEQAQLIRTMKRVRKPSLLLVIVFLVNTVYLLHTLNGSFEVDSLPGSSLDGLTKMKQTKKKRKVKVIDPSQMTKMFIYNTGSWDGAPIVVEEHKLIFFTLGKVGLCARVRERLL